MLIDSGSYPILTSMDVVDDLLLIAESSLTGREWKGVVKVFQILEASSIISGGVQPCFVYALPRTIAQVLFMKNPSKVHEYKLIIATDDGSLVTMELPLDLKPLSLSPSNAIEQACQQQRVFAISSNYHNAPIQKMMICHLLPPRHPTISAANGHEKESCTDFVSKSACGELCMLDAEGTLSLWDISHTVSPHCQWQAHSWMNGLSCGSAASTASITLLWDLTSSPPVSSKHRDDCDREEEEEEESSSTFVSPLSQARQRVGLVTAMGSELAVWSRRTTTVGLAPDRRNLHRDSPDSPDLSSVCCLHHKNLIVTGDVAGNLSFFDSKNISEGPLFGGFVSNDKKLTNKHVIFLLSNHRSVLAITEPGLLCVLDVDKIMKHVGKNNQTLGDGDDADVTLEEEEDNSDDYDDDEEEEDAFSKYRFTCDLHHDDFIVSALVDPNHECTLWTCARNSIKRHFIDYSNQTVRSECVSLVRT